MEGVAQEMGAPGGSGDEVVSLLLNQISLPARRDYELRSSSPVLKSADRSNLYSPPSSSSQLGGSNRAFQNVARAVSFNAAAHHGGTVPFVLHQAPNQRVFFSGPLSSDATPRVAHHVRAAATATTRERSDSDVVGASFRRRGGLSYESPSFRRAYAKEGSLIDASRITIAHPKPRATMAEETGCDREVRGASRGSTRRASWGKEDTPARGGSGDVTHTCEPKVVVEEKKKRGESNRRRPTASIAWDSLNESQANSPQREFAAIPFQWEEAPGKPLADPTMRDDSQPQPPTARLATTTSTTESSSSSSTLSSREEAEHAHSHRFYARAALPPRKSSFDASSAGHLISEVVTPEAHIDLVAPAAAKFLLESWGGHAAAPAAHVAVPFQWEEAPGVPKEDAGAESKQQPVVKPVQLQLPPRLTPIPPPGNSPVTSKEEMRGRMRTRSMSGPLAGYYPHTSPARRRQLQHSPGTQQRRSCSPSKRESASPVSRIRIVAIPKRDGILSPDYDDLTTTSGAGAGLLSEFARSSSPRSNNNSPSSLIHSLTKQLTCKIRPPASSSGHQKYDPCSIPQDELSHLSGPSSSNNSDMDASSQTPVSDATFSKSSSRVSYESFEHSFANSSSPPGSLPMCEDFRERRGSLGAAEGVKAVVKMCRTGNATLRKSKAQHEMWAPTLASYFRCLEAATMTAGTMIGNSNSARASPIAITHNNTELAQQECEKESSSAPQTRLPYTMPTIVPAASAASSAHGDQNVLWKDYCESPHAEVRTVRCLGVTFPAVARSISRGRNHHHHHGAPWSSIPNGSCEDGYRSPAYAATLELLSPSAELFRKKSKRAVLSTSRSVKLVMPSRRKAQFLEAMCTSLKRALFRCAKRCCRKATSPPPLKAASQRF